MESNPITDALYAAVFQFNAVVEGARDEGFVVAFEVTKDGLLGLHVTEPSGDLVVIRPKRKEDE